MVNKPFVFALLCLTAPIPIRADVGDYESARAALERGDVLPLAAILEKVEQDRYFKIFFEGFQRICQAIGHGLEHLGLRDWHHFGPGHPPLRSHPLLQFVESQAVSLKRH